MSQVRKSEKSKPAPRRRSAEAKALADPRYRQRVKLTLPADEKARTALLRAWREGDWYDDFSGGDHGC